MLLPATLAVLVISCPCALSLATPAAIASSSRYLLEHGVLLTRGAALEALSGVDTVVFDKTGTLTTGTPVITEIMVNPARQTHDQQQLRHIAAHLEVDSSHPVAHAFLSSEVDRSKVKDLVNHENGVSGSVNRRHYRLGSPEFCGVDIDAFPQEEKSRVWLADDDGWLACFVLDDGLRDGALTAIKQLESRNIDLVILSGDHHQAVRSIAGRTGIETFHSEQSPAMKMSYLKSLQARGKTVLMVGDGINDAPVLSVADVSMTVSGASELANSTADFIITGKSLINIIDVLDSSRRTRFVIRQNLSWALSYNLLAVPFAAAGLIVPWMAALGMSLSSLLVVLNSGRLARSAGKASEPVSPNGVKVT